MNSPSIFFEIGSSIFAPLLANTRATFAPNTLAPLALDVVFFTPDFVPYLVLPPISTNEQFQQFMQAYIKDYCQLDLALALLADFKKDVLNRFFKAQNPDFNYGNL